MQYIRICEMPDCKMVSSGVGMFGEEKFERFNQWFSSQKRSLFPKDFLYFAGEGFIWLYMLENELDVPSEFDIIDFKGGLYAVATDIDQKTDMDAMNEQIDEFLINNGLEHDDSRPQMGNIITSPSALEIMGYEQMDYFFPVKPINV